jgi:hypothetical protein
VAKSNQGGIETGLAVFDRLSEALMAKSNQGAIETERKARRALCRMAAKSNQGGIET